MRSPEWSQQATSRTRPSLDESIISQIWQAPILMIAALAFVIIQLSCSSKHAHVEAFQVVLTRRASRMDRPVLSSVHPCKTRFCRIEDTSQMYRQDIFGRSSHPSERRLSPLLLASESRSDDSSMPGSDEESNESSNQPPDETVRVGDGEAKKRSKATTARAGGRKNTPRPAATDEKDDKKGGAFGAIAKFAGPLLAAFLLLRLLLGGIFGGATTTSSPDFVYYQSSFYESRSINADGKVETARKESVRSNIPSLLEKNQRDGRPGRIQDGTASFYLDDFPEDKFDRELDSAMRTIFDDYF